MKKENIEFIERLKSVRRKAQEENVCVKTIYQRIDKGIYRSIKIDGIIFIVEEPMDTIVEDIDDLL